jgi:polyhydroxybutyrate depolymerase
MKRYLLLLSLAAFLAQAASAQRFFQVNWQNKVRNVVLYLPENFSPSENLPVVINMHGFLTTAAFQMNYTQFNKTADTARCIVLYPEGVNLRWNSGTFFFVPSDVDDVGFLGDLLDRMAVLYNADLSRAYSMGYSAGGFMSYKLACDATNRIAAIAPNVASMVFDNLSSCVPVRPISIAAFNGLADPITPYFGFPGNFPGIDSIRHFWQIKNNCAVVPLTDTLPDISDDGTIVVRYTYQNCADNAEQVFYKIINGGHVWPGADDFLLNALGKTTRDISMNTVAWNFFKEKQIPANVRCESPDNLVAVPLASDSFLLSWTTVAAANSYKVALADDSGRVTFIETSGNSIRVGIDPSKRIRWNVGALCSSGYHSWNSTQPLNFTPTFIRTKTSETIRVFPNPATDIIQLNLPDNLPAQNQLTILDVSGKKIMRLENVQRDNVISVSQLAEGWYQLWIETNDKNYIASFIKN